ncbi:facilitated trehalose transporter Tret1-2 homolog isoform X2 [Zootermopsis nevadensis]|uniref:facilitated trehalose transporter Tret1-2 homolog isoform X2 n=1 Tax=Zootermopsis nevadensis TaxID=136037 RepID=UPI000B8E5A57|nr:facilitated trehalose transporter Tret1-2 homolog isoform X2 [Zootermopsis nevadensis]
MGRTCDTFFPLDVSATLSAACAGAVDGWTAAGIPHLEQAYNLTDNITVPGITYDEGSWIGSLSPLGSLVGAIPAGYLANLMGRRLLMLIMAAPMFLGWVMIIFADKSILVLYTARFILGFTCGIITVASPLYSEEIAEVRIRGALGVYLDLMFNVGILYVYVVGAVLPYLWMSIASTMLPLLFAVTFFWMPESPIYLLSKDQIEEAEKSLSWLRGADNQSSASIEDELKEMQSFIKRNKVSISVSGDQTSLPVKIINVFKSISVTSATMKAMNIIFGLMTLRQLCGMNAVLAYTVNIFEEAGSSLDPHLCTVIVGIIQLISTCIPSFIVDCIGRRILLIISGAGMGVCLLLMVIRFYLLNQGIEITLMGWLPLIAVNLYIVACSIGFGPLPWFMMPELLSNEAKSWVSSIAVCLNWALAFLVTKFFPIMINDMGPEATYGTFFIICLLGTIFVMIFVPETKGKTREEILCQLSGK